jgi:predicted nucleic acid-binding protein
VRYNPSKSDAAAVDRTGGLEICGGAPRLGLAVLVPTERHADVAEEVILELPHLSGNLLHDAHTAILMREHGIGRICTRDTDFNQFKFLEIIDPVRPGY